MWREEPGRTAGGFVARLVGQSGGGQRGVIRSVLCGAESEKVSLAEGESHA